MQEFAKEKLHLHRRFADPRHYFLMATKDDNESVKPGWWERMALLHYAVLRTTNTARLVGGIPGSEASRALWQAALEGAKGCGLLKCIRQAGLEEQARSGEEPSSPAAS